VLLPSPEESLALTSQDFDAVCPMTTVAPALLHVTETVAPAPLMPVSDFAVAPTTLKPAVKTTTLLEPGRTLRDAYHNILDDLDDDKELTFAHMQHASE
jgi:hypothetical protein